MKTALIAIAVCIAVIAIVFAIPSIPVPVQRTETYTEAVTKQEPYTVFEKQQVSTPHVSTAYQLRQQFDSEHKIWVLCFKIVAPEILSSVCDCSAANAQIGRTEIEGTPFLCVADNGKIHISWLVNESDRGTSQADLACPLHIGFTPYPKGTNVNFYNTDKRGWQGEVEFSPNGLPTSQFYSERIAAALYTNKEFNIFAVYGYDCGYIGKMPPVNITVDYISYTTETVNKEVTKYREVPAMVEKQRTVTDYQKISVWQRLLGQ